MRTNLRVVLIAALCVVGVFSPAFNAQVPDELFAGLKWRNIGPYHGGRISAVTGAVGPGQDGIFYVGAPIGGLWKTTSGGVTWFQIFDQFKNVDSIGAVQVAPSDPNIVYVGTGDSVGGPSGDGMYKSTDAGKTFIHIGLDETTKINKIVIDPKDPDRVVVSTQGDATHNGRGIYRTTDGGKTWENTLRPDNANGTRDVEYAFDKPNVIFATSQGSGGGFGGGGGGFGGGAPQGPNGTALFKSTDEGKTWKKVDSLPAYTGRISVAVAMHTDGKRIYVIGNAPQPGGPSGLYRSDDQGDTWQHMAVGDNRVGNGQGAFSSGVWVDSQNPDILYVVSTYVTQSADGGKTFNVFKGAPGGEDPHDIWIDPTNGHRMLFGFDQGPAVTLDNGHTWSGYYQIPIAQLYKVSTDTRYPYWVLGSQQDTGAVMTRSRGDLGQVTNLDWYPLQSSEFGTAVPDPLKPTTVYGVGYGLGQGSGMTKIDTETGQWGNVAPNFGIDRDMYAEGRDFWKRFDTAFEPKAMYAGYNCILVTRDGAESWKPFSPDLTTPKGQPMLPCGVP
ncbi:MAG: glycoside hydrolase, partial [Acidobacteria bacterium]|nr:glycoside hydrolase [Acidobacteriota bacterium]